MAAPGFALPSPSLLVRHHGSPALRGTVLFGASHPGRLNQTISPYGSKSFGSQNCSIQKLSFVMRFFLEILTGAPGGNRTPTVGSEDRCSIR